MSPKARVLLAIMVISAWLSLAGAALALALTKGIN